MPQNTKAGDASRRPTRTIKKSVKAQEIEDSGEVVPGFLSPDQDNLITSLTSSLATSPFATAAFINMPASAVQARSHETRIIKVLGPEKFAIYFWPRPVPKDFTDLPYSYRAWKRRVDEKEGAKHLDDGTDDWYEYGDLGDEWYEPFGKNDGVAAVRCIASSFKNRAKVAFRKGKTWDEFEDQEQRAYNEPIARARCPNGMVDVLSGRLRTDVWHAIRERLCNEIWLQEYTGPPGLVRLPVGIPQGRVDSAVTSPVDIVGASGLGSARTVQRRIRQLTAEEAERKIKGFTEMDDGTWQPFYKGETGAPVPILEQFRGVRR